MVGRYLESETLVAPGIAFRLEHLAEATGHALVPGQVREALEGIVLDVSGLSCCWFRMKRAAWVWVTQTKPCKVDDASVFVPHDETEDAWTHLTLARFPALNIDQRLLRLDSKLPNSDLQRCGLWTWSQFPVRASPEKIFDLAPACDISRWVSKHVDDEDESEEKEAEGAVFSEDSELEGTQPVKFTAENCYFRELIEEADMEATHVLIHLDGQARGTCVRRSEFANFSESLYRLSAGDDSIQVQHVLLHAPEVAYGVTAYIDRAGIDTILNTRFAQFNFVPENRGRRTDQEIPAMLYKVVPCEQPM